MPKKSIRGSERIRTALKPVEKSLKTRNLRFTMGKDHTRTTQTIVKLYRDPVLRERTRKGKLSFEFTYDYLIPLPLRPRYGGRSWKRIEVVEDLNISYKQGPDAFEAYCAVLKASIIMTLKAGYNPFAAELEQHFADKLDIDLALAPKDNWDVTQAFNYFRTDVKDRSITDDSKRKYNNACDLFINWLKARNLQFMPVKAVQYKHIELCMKEAQSRTGWGNREFNNQKNNLSAAFSYLLKEGVITMNPCHKLLDKPTQTSTHKFYDEETFKKVRQTMEQDDPYLLFAAQIVYHLCIRSEKELSLLQVKHISVERKQVHVPAENAKNSKGEWVPMNDEMLRIFQVRGVFNYPPDYYIFTSLNGGKFYPDGTPGKVPFKKQFFSSRFRRIRLKLHLETQYTLYGFKHTKAVHFILDGGRPEELMVLMRHHDLAATMKYLRDLGVQVDQQKIHKRARDF